MKKRTLNRESAIWSYNGGNVKWLTLLSPRQQIPPSQVYKPCDNLVQRWSSGSLCNCEVLPFPKWQWRWNRPGRVGQAICRERWRRWHLLESRWRWRQTQYISPQPLRYPLPPFPILGCLGYFCEGLGRVNLGAYWIKKGQTHEQGNKKRCQGWMQNRETGELGWKKMRPWGQGHHPPFWMTMCEIEGVMDEGWWYWMRRGRLRRWIWTWRGNTIIYEIYFMEIMKTWVGYRHMRATSSRPQSYHIIPESPTLPCFLYFVWLLENKIGLVAG